MLNYLDYANALHEYISVRSKPIGRVKRPITVENNEYPPVARGEHFPMI
jgi:hypothetical protein